MSSAVHRRRTPPTSPQRLTTDCPRSLSPAAPSQQTGQRVRRSLAHVVRTRNGEPTRLCANACVQGAACVSGQSAACRRSTPRRVPANLVPYVHPYLCSIRSPARDTGAYIRSYPTCFRLRYPCRAVDAPAATSRVVTPPFGPALSHPHRVARPNEAPPPAGALYSARRAPSHPGAFVARCACAARTERVGGLGQRAISPKSRKGLLRCSRRAVSRVRRRRAESYCMLRRTARRVGFGAVRDSVQCGVSDAPVLGPGGA
ncbi:hypothetical protein C8R43DRAFT_1132250 [Mycena crocata]|nr:hypothetical protein C8R43DRAFT_1132250 [Mycena crocata]